MNPLLKISRRPPDKQAWPNMAYVGSGAKMRLYKDWITRQSSGSFLSSLLGITPKESPFAEYMRRATAGRRYIDLTAGSCNLPFLMGKHHSIPATTNDASYYSYCISAGTLARKAFVDMGEVVKHLGAALASGRSGFITSDCPLGETAGPISPAEAKQIHRFLDAWISRVRTHFPLGACEFLMACTGGAMLKRMTFRSMRWWGTQTDGSLVTPEHLARQILTTASAKNHHFWGRGEASHATASEFVETYKKFKGAVVTFDPAWPYSEEQGGKNPYHLFYKIGEYLKQEKTPEYIWEDNALDRVITDVLHWIHTALSKGALEVLVWNQTTNKPSKKELEAILAEHFRSETITVLRHQTRGKKRTFLDYVISCKPR